MYTNKGLFIQVKYFTFVVFWIYSELYSEKKNTKSFPYLYIFCIKTINLTSKANWKDYNDIWNKI